MSWSFSSARDTANQRIKKIGNTINAAEYQTSLSNALVSSLVSDNRTDILAFANNQLLKYQSCDDYQELVLLKTIAYLADMRNFCTISHGIHCSCRTTSGQMDSNGDLCPKDLDVQRGMKFKLTKQEEKRIHDIYLFIVL